MMILSRSSFKGLFSLTIIFGLFLSLSSISHAQTRRTDGPIGSEYGSKSWLEGDLQLGAHFGVRLDQSKSKDSSFLVGADVDYRPFDLFGIRLSGFQALQKPRSTHIHLSPVLHTEISNFHPYVLAGPGISLVNQSGTKTKFSLAFGGGGDFFFGERLGLGMMYQYISIFDARDVHQLGARLILRFPAGPY